MIYWDPLRAATKQGNLRYEVIQTVEGAILISIDDFAESNKGGACRHQVNGKKNISEDANECLLK